MAKRDYYEILGVTKSATSDEIKHASDLTFNEFLAKLSLHHPVLAQASAGPFYWSSS